MEAKKESNYQKKQKFQIAVHKGVLKGPPVVISPRKSPSPPTAVYKEASNL